MLFGFFMRLVIARFYSVEDYGIFNLYYSFLLIFGTVGALGLRDGLNRYIGYYKGKNEEESIASTIKWGIIIGIISGILLGALLIFTSQYIAPILSEDPKFESYLQLVGITTPFLVIFYVIISIFRGFERAKERIIFSSLGKQSLILIAVSIVGLMALPFEMLIIAVSVAVIAITIVLYIYYRKKIKNFVNKSVNYFQSSELGKSLLLFSIPLLLVSIMAKVMSYTDTMMLAYFHSEVEVGLYNAAKPVSRFIRTGLIVAIFIYQPIVSRLYAQKNFEENEVIYTSLTKWLSFFTLPLTLSFILFPQVVLSVFGADYRIAASTLQVLALIYFFRNIIGPTHSTLIAYGKSKFVMYANSMGALLNVVVNALLIPVYGPLGAAIATGVSLLGMTSIKALKLYNLSGVHSIKYFIFKPLLIISVIVLPIGLLINRIITVNLIVLGTLFFIFLIISFFTIILTKSLSKEDKKLLLLMEKRAGLDLKRTKKWLNRFL